MAPLLYGLVAFSLWKLALATTEDDACSLQPRVEVPATRILEPVLPGDLGSQITAGSSIVLANETSMLWGKSGDADNVMVNVTLATDQTQMILSMDSFKEELLDVDCDNSLVLSFKSEETYQDAIDEWEWVNFNERRTFVMVVNWGDCSAESGRQPWVVSGATYDNANHKVHFTAAQTAWANLTNPYEISWGSYEPAAGSPLAARWNPVDADKLASRAINKKFDINLAHDLPAVLFQTEVAAGVEVTLGCEDCRTTGKLTIAGRLKGSLFSFSIDEASIEAFPTNVGADFNPSVSVSADLVQPLTKTFDILNLPLSPFSIPLVFSLGPTLRLSAGVELSALKGTASVKAGVSAKIPDYSSAKVDFTGKDNHVIGWKPEFTTRPVQLAAQVDGTVAAFTAIGVDLALTLFNSIDFGVGLDLKVPKVTMDLGAEINTQGNVCPNRPEIFGVKFDLSIGADLSFKAFAGDKDKPLFDQKIFDEPAIFAIPQQCFAFGTIAKPPVHAARSLIEGVEGLSPVTGRLSRHI